MSFQATLTNHTPFAADRIVQMDPEGQETALVVVAATFVAETGGAMRLADDQPPILVKDRYRGDPVGSSLVVENELALHKPLVDVIASATAYAPGGRPAERVAVEFRAEDVHKTLLVTGERTWSGGAATRPVPFIEMPIQYERAFGGKSPRTGELWADNPVGIGFDAATGGEVPGEIPNVEHPNAVMT